MRNIMTRCLLVIMMVILLTSSLSTTAFAESIEVIDITNKSIISVIDSLEGLAEENGVELEDLEIIAEYSSFNEDDSIVHHTISVVIPRNNKMTVNNSNYSTEVGTVGVMLFNSFAETFYNLCTSLIITIK